DRASVIRPHVLSRSPASMSTSAARPLAGHGQPGLRNDGTVRFATGPEEQARSRPTWLDAGRGDEPLGFGLALGSVLGEALRPDAGGRIARWLLVEYDSSI
ncbi:hypothetical protein, partial [Amycolatopsis anabasis]|uniref:hypothetical protein n=1 Tax=Amycolatopsis anabasis TaxID=1840409 RepID=UPI001C551B29